MWQPSLVPLLFCGGIIGTSRDAVIENWGFLLLLLLLNIFITDWRLLWQKRSDGIAGNVFFANWDLFCLNSFPAWHGWVFLQNIWFRIWSIAIHWKRLMDHGFSVINLNTFSHTRGVQIVLHLVGSGWSRARYWFHTENFSSATWFTFFKCTCTHLCCTAAELAEFVQAKIRQK